MPLVLKVTALKNRLEKDLEELKQKLLRSEQGLQASQMKEAELKKKFDVSSLFLLKKRY